MTINNTTINVLIVEDDDSVGRSLQMNFQSHNIPVVDVADSYESALLQIEKTRYALIVVDGLEGKCFDLIDAAKDIPHGDFIIFSAVKDLETEAKLREIPFYEKPYGLVNLDKLLAKYISYD